MEVLAFSLGLGLGAVIIVIQQVRLNRNLQYLLSRLESHGPPPARGGNNATMTSRLMVAVGQKHQEQVQLKEILSGVQELITHAPLAYLQVDRDNHLVWCNLEAARLARIEHPSPKRPRLLLEQIRSYDLDRLIEKTRLSQRPYQREWVLHPLNPDPLNPDPRESIQILGHGVPLPEGQIGVFLENRQELFRLTQQRDRWVSDVAHELKTPLTSIRLVAEMLEERVDPTYKPWMQRLLGEVLHLSNLVHDLLDLNLLERRSPQSLKLSQFDFITLIHSVWSSLEPFSSKKNVTLSYEGPEQLPIDGDQSRLYRVLLNLLDNAIKYSPGDSQIWIRLTPSPGPLSPEQRGLVPLLPNNSLASFGNNAKPPSDNPSTIPSEDAAASPETAITDVNWDSWLSLDIIDQGPGLPEADLSHIFERFYRVDPARARPQDHLGPSPSNHQPINTELRTMGSCGLGLAIVRQIIVAHGGVVRAQNHPETQGAWIQVSLPQRQPAPHPQRG